MANLRNFKIGDENSLWNVFYSSIHQVCSDDYTEEQVEAWAPKDLDPSIWIAKIQSIKPLVAVVGEKIVGYTDLQEDGKIDHFFVHGDYQGQGIGAKLLTKVIEMGFHKDKLYSEVSHTAKPFFKKYGFKVITEQQVIMRGVALSNNIMERRNEF